MSDFNPRRRGCKDLRITYGSRLTPRATLTAGLRAMPNCAAFTAVDVVLLSLVLLQHGRQSNGSNASNRSDTAANSAGSLGVLMTVPS